MWDEKMWTFASCRNGMLRNSTALPCLRVDQELAFCTEQIGNLTDDIYVYLLGERAMASLEFSVGRRRRNIGEVEHV